MTRQELVDKAAASGEIIKQNVDKVPEQELAELYGLFSQLKHGDNNSDKPTTGGKDLARWEAWSTKKGLSDEQAYERLMKLQKEVISKHLE